VNTTIVKQSDTLIIAFGAAYMGAPTETKVALRTRYPEIDPSAACAALDLARNQHRKEWIAEFAESEDPLLRAAAQRGGKAKRQDTDMFAHLRRQGVPTTAKNKAKAEREIAKAERKAERKAAGGTEMVPWGQVEHAVRLLRRAGYDVSPTVDAIATVIFGDPDLAWAFSAEGEEDIRFRAVKYADGPTNSDSTIAAARRSAVIEACKRLGSTPVKTATRDTYTATVLAFTEKYPKKNVVQKLIVLDNICDVNGKIVRKKQEMGRGLWAQPLQVGDLITMQAMAVNGTISRPTQVEVLSKKGQP
jgi:hypothetical protein